jgi:anaerobic nitric oxide reductase transcription regulator
VLGAVHVSSGASSADEAAGAILRALSRTTPADALAVLRAGEDGALSVAAQMGLSPAALDVTFRPAEHPRLARAARSRLPLRFGDPREKDPYASSGNAAKAARLLGLSRSFAYKEAIRLGIMPPRRV